jgi:PAS domain S-box-containing protein
MPDVPFDRIFEESPVGMAVVDPGFRLLRANRALCRLLGYSEDELRDLKNADLVYPPDRDLDAEQAKRVFEGSLPGYQVEKRYVTREGAAVWVCLTVTALRDEQGGLQYLLALFEEITARREAADARAYLAAIVDSSDDAILSASLDGRIRSWNRGAGRLFGYTAHEIIEQPITTLLPPERTAEEPAILARIRRGERVEHYETVRMRKDGTRFHASLTVSPIRDETGRILGASKIIRDVTERRLAEEELHRAHQELDARVRERTAELTAANAALARQAEQVRAVTAAARCILWHARVEDRGGPFPEWETQIVDEEAARRAMPVAVAPGESFIHAAYHCRIYEDHDRYNAMVAERLRRNEGFEAEFRCRMADGSVRWFVERVSVTPVAPGKWWAVGVTVDITDRKRVEDELKASSEQLAAMSQQLWQTAKLATMGELAASVAHELNNPLGTVTLRVELLLAQLADDDPRRPGLEVVEQEVERMGQLVSNLLQFSRRSQQQVSTLDVRDEIAKSLELIRHHLRNRRIAVELQLAPDLPMIRADRQQLRQVFLNLFTNAADAMPDGGTLTVRGASNGAVVLEVVDTGTGIPPEVLARVREPFFTTKPEGKGTGLGLAISSRILQEHGGSLEIESALGVGTTVRLYLPRVSSAWRGGK